MLDRKMLSQSKAPARSGDADQNQLDHRQNQQSFSNGEDVNGRYAGGLIPLRTAED